jgi:hypothetical protein
MSLRLREASEKRGNRQVLYSNDVYDDSQKISKNFWAQPTSAPKNAFEAPCASALVGAHIDVRPVACGSELR